VNVLAALPLYAIALSVVALVGAGAAA